MSRPRNLQTVKRKVARLQDQRRRYGLGHMALLATRNRIEDVVLSIEGRRGVLGPAHQGYGRHSVDANRDTWTGWDWESGGGEEWTVSEPWKASLIEELLIPNMPADGVLMEIGPGAGRWSPHLLARAGELVLVDLTARTLETCRRQLGDPPNVRYVLNDGRSLPGVEDESIDGSGPSTPSSTSRRWTSPRSARDRRGCAPAPRGDPPLRPGKPVPSGWRSPMTRKLFANLASEAGLEVDSQFNAWAGGQHGVAGYGDAMTIMHSPAIAEAQVTR